LACSAFLDWLFFCLAGLIEKEVLRDFERGQVEYAINRLIGHRSKKNMSSLDWFFGRLPRKGGLPSTLSGRRPVVARDRD
jgi:hypothetical protein